MHGSNTIKSIIAEIGELESVARYGQDRLIEVGSKVKVLEGLILQVSNHQQASELKSRITELRASLQATHASLSAWKQKLEAHLAWIHVQAQNKSELSSKKVNFSEIVEKISNLLKILSSQTQFINQQKEKLDHLAMTVEMMKKNLSANFEKGKAPVLIADFEDDDYIVEY